eukprot:CAMPEP_0117443808 /NCGR_PEP_ID=MMETSP0759-20121206/4900_1 /TAXON_ID=63605 /ORGANISM="Percolomonas cosmopolitus, Strain WS" /LENGTH=758 /DNA_ID=CAMNT_0005235823 /DNA_START=31 /DNA_END=2308 /DNA_ORIENTATION=+
MSSTHNPTSTNTTKSRRLPLPEEIKPHQQRFHSHHFNRFEKSQANNRREFQPKKTTHHVKDKRPATTQITAEQILIMANARKEKLSELPKMIIQDKEELRDYQKGRREQFERTVSQYRKNPNAWVRYAMWEDAQNEYERARSVFERAIEQVYTSPNIWERYAEMEMKRKFVNHARNVLDRAVTLLPRVDALWQKYVHMEEMLNQVPNARKIYERWMKWHPTEESWKLYVQMELRYHEIDRCRTILERLLKVHPKISSWLYYTKFEQKHGAVDRARQIFERALQELCVFQSNALPGDTISEEQHHRVNERLLIAFARFEQNFKEYDRARVIFRFALDNIPKGHARRLYDEFTTFEKQFGGKDTIMDVISSRCRFQYEQQLQNDSTDYDTWFDYIRLEESKIADTNEYHTTRELYERAIANFPPVKKKEFWKRYVYLWIKYALFEEVRAKNPDHARQVYRMCLDYIPHEEFSFSKIWIMFARFEVRQKNLDRARDIFNEALQMAPSEKIFKAYLRTEILLGNIDETRDLYERLLEFNVSNCHSWEQYAKLEAKLGNVERSRQIFELAVQQPVLDMPEVIWKDYIDFEIEYQENDRVVQLYERLLNKTKHVKVWISFALFQKSIENYDEARKIFTRAEHFLFSNMEDESNAQMMDNAQVEYERKEERYHLLREWLKFEQEIPNGQPDQVQRKMPKEVTKKRPLIAPDGTSLGFEEYIDYEFPDQQKTVPGKRKKLSKLLANAQAWKKQKVGEDGLESVTTK